MLECSFSLEAMPITVVLRRLLLITLLVLPQVYWLGMVWRSGRHSRLRQWLARLLVLSAATAMIAVLYDSIGIRFLPPALSSAIAPPVQLWVFASTFAFFLTMLLRSVAWCCAKVIGLVKARTAAHDPSRRTMLCRAASVVGSAPFAFALYGFAHERLQFSVERVDVPVANLPPALDGLRIAQLSDIHAGDLMPLREIGRAVGMTNELEPHIAVITGDFITSRGDPLPQCIRELSRLRAPLGVWGCNGNHEIYAEAEEQAEALFADYGMRLLRGSAAQVQWRGSFFNLIGIDYQHGLPTDGTVMPGLNGAEGLIRRDMPNILLSHNPDTFPRAAAAGVELSLSGHTHGGQIDFQVLHTRINPARVLTGFIAGLYRLPLMNGSRQQACLYVNRGLGTLGLPARIGSKPEITLMTLRSSSAS